MDTQKSVVFLYISNEQSKTKIKNITLFTLASTIKYPAIYLTKEVQDLYTENYNILLSEN